MKVVVDKLKAASAQGSHEASSLLGNIFQGYGCKKDYKLAIPYYLAASKNVQAQYNVSIIFHELGDVQRQEAALKDVIKLDPTFTSAYQNLGMIQKNKAVDEHDPLIAAAKENFRRAVHLDPTLVPALNMLAIIHIVDREYEEAVSVFEQSCACFEKYQKVEKTYGVIYDRVTQIKHFEKTKSYLACLKSSLKDEKALREIRDLTLQFK